MKFSRHFLIISAVCLVSMSTFASRMSVKAKLDSVQLLMGRITTLRLEVVQPKDVKAGFQIFQHPSPEGIIGVCGDSVELRTSFSRDTADLGDGRIRIDYAVPVQAFDSGAYRLPQFLYISGRDTARSNSVSLKVIPVPVAADAQISDYVGPLSPDGSLFDFLPDWMVDLWWLWLSIVLLAILFVIGIRRYRKQGGQLVARKKQPNPYEVAIRRLDNLKSRKLWEQGMEKEYFTLLTDILREYLEKRFDINAMEMTSRQIIDSLSSNPEVKEKRGYMREILDVADFVKFAKVRPLPADNIAAFENARKFVEETRPIENTEDLVSDTIDPQNNIRTGIDLPSKKGISSDLLNPDASDRRKGGEE